MCKRLNFLLMLVVLLNVIFLATITFNGWSARAAAKKTYKAEIVVTDTTKIQTTLDQRAAEGWQLVAASGHTSTAEDVIVLIFEKQ
jgi:uncharacterized membrane protein